MGEDGDHLQLIKFWPSFTPGRGSAAGWKLLQPARSFCISRSAFFINNCYAWMPQIGVSFFLSTSRALSRMIDWKKGLELALNYWMNRPWKALNFVGLLAEEPRPWSYSRISANEMECFPMHSCGTYVEFCCDERFVLLLMLRNITVCLLSLVMDYVITYIVYNYYTMTYFCHSNCSTCCFRVIYESVLPVCYRSFSPRAMKVIITASSITNQQQEKLYCSFCYYQFYLG